MVFVRPWPHFGDHQVLFSHLWSLSVEEQFYIVWPFLISLLLWFRARPAIVFGLLAIGIIAPAVARFWLYESWEMMWLYFRTDLRADAILWGVLLAWIFYLGFAPRHRWARSSFGVGGIAALIGLVGMSVYDLLSNGFMYHGGFSLVGFLSAVLIGVAVWCPAAPLRLMLEWGPLCWIGKVSYGLYIWHYPMLWIPRTLGWGPYEAMSAGMVATFVIATISFYFWERPFLSLKDRIGHRPVDEQRCSPNPGPQAICESSHPGIATDSGMQEQY
jgi:peptidoglycan/LPS O-acetylase OafA/YrhL